MLALRAQVDFARQETTENMPQLRVALLGQIPRSAQVEARHDLGPSIGLMRRRAKFLRQLWFIKHYTYETRHWANGLNINVLKRSILILLLIAGLILFIDGIFLHKIKTDVYITIANHHIHHWMYGLVIIVVAVILLLVLLWFSRPKKVERKAS